MNTDFEATSNILVFIALPEEHDLFLEAYPSLASLDSEINVVLEHDISTSGFRMFSVLSEDMGTDSAYDAVQRAIDLVKPNLVVCLGIAGSLTTDMKIGDVSVSNEVIDVSQNMKIKDVPASPRKRRSAKKRGSTRAAATKTVIELSPKHLGVPTSLSASFRFARSHPDLKSKLAGWIENAEHRRQALAEVTTDPALSQELPLPPLSEVGAIISGPVVASSAFREVLKRLDRKVLCVETESAGVFRAARAQNIPSVTIRGISDHADVNKNAFERTTKLGARKLAMENAVSYFGVQLLNPSFMRNVSFHREGLQQPELFVSSKSLPDDTLFKVTRDLDAYLERMSPEYRHRPNNANLPLPRLGRDVVEDDVDETANKGPQSIYSSLNISRRIYLKIPKSYPNQTLAWSIGQALLAHEMDERQILPLVVSGDEIMPPYKGICHATGISWSENLLRNFTPVIIVSEPPFHSEVRSSFLIDELSKYSSAPIVIVSRAEAPIEQIERLKGELGLVDHSTAPVPFDEIANYLEVAFEMKPAQADSVASRLNETFSKFRMHTHPAYFVGLQEATIDALIEANQRAELIQLAVDGLLSFVVVFDESPVKLSRTTREEFLSDLAFEIRVNRTVMSRRDVEEYVEKFGQRKALEVKPSEFLRGYFAVGLLHETGGKVAFSLPYLEAYLLSERLRFEPNSAKAYFNPWDSDFDHFAFDLYIERGASPEVVGAVCDYARSALDDCDADPNVYEARTVKPRALASPQLLLHIAEGLSQATVRMTETSDAADVRQEKQRLLDTREAIRGRVASRDPLAPSAPTLPEDLQTEFKLLNRLSRSSTLLATLIGSGAERLDGSVKEEVATLVLSVFERFLHHWTKNRGRINFDELREELKSDEDMDKLILELGLFQEDRDEIRENLLLFLDDQELRFLSAPASILLSRLAQYAGVRSLRPIFTNVKGKTMMQRVFRDTWLMDVEYEDGRRALKNTLQNYKGSPLLRLVITSHLLNRVFWHHWQKRSKSSFVDVARYSVAPLKLRPSPTYTDKVLSGPKSRR